MHFRCADSLDHCGAHVHTSFGCVFWGLCFGVCVLCMVRRAPGGTQCGSSAASDVYRGQRRACLNSDTRVSRVSDERSLCAKVRYLVLQ